MINYQSNYCYQDISTTQFPLGLPALSPATTCLTPLFLINQMSKHHVIQKPRINFISPSIVSLTLHALIHHLLLYFQLLE